MDSIDSEKFKFKTLIREHWVAIVLAVLVGTVAVGPQIAFIYQMGDEYQGLYMMAINDEDIYLSRMQEIVDGHASLGSAWFYEGKDNLPLYPPTSDLILVGISKLLSLSLVNTLILVKFLFPSALFLFVYALVYGLSGGSKVSSLAGGLLITLGIDMTEFGNLVKFFTGRFQPVGFLMWTRPSNPIHGALIIFSSLLIIRSFQNSISKKKIFAAAVLFALGVMSYFFTWGILLAAMASLAAIYFYQKRYDLVKALAVVMALGLLLALPYFFLTWSASRDPSFAGAAVRNGTIFNHVPFLNKTLLASLLAFFLLSWKTKKADWWWFCLTLLVGGLLAINQQVITGIGVWPHHFVQYTVPLSVVALLVIIYKNIRPYSKILWSGFITAIIALSLSAGVLRQASAYIHNFEKYRDRQKLVELFEWFNEHTEKDSVILHAEPAESFLTRLLPAYTHNNVYLGSYGLLMLVPPERVLHNYMVELRLNNVRPEELESFLDNHPNPGNFKFYFGGLEDVKNRRTTEKFLRDKDLVFSAYPEFYRRDFYNELKKYRLDYILSQDPWPGQPLLAEIAGYKVYPAP